MFDYEQIISKIESLLNKNGLKAIEIKQLPQSGSYRKYFRIFLENETLIAVYNQNLTENKAFLGLTEHFSKLNINVPKIVIENLEENIYITEDLGDTTVYDFLANDTSESDILKLYKKIIDDLINIQFYSIEKIDKNILLEPKYFDSNQIWWDLEYFKNLVLKVSQTKFNEKKLEDDFKTLINNLLRVPNNYLVYRDFQSKNIMLKEGVPYYIDYQGAKIGAFYYDLVSLLYDSKANLSENIRDKLKNYYFEKIQNIENVTREEFEDNFFNFTIVRLLQATAAYCFRGYVEKRINFVKSLPLALKNLSILLSNSKIETYPELKNALYYFVEKSLIANLFKPRKDVYVRINSFSYHKNGYPIDEYGNGGGFVFDCRGLPNPGAIDYYKQFSGLDKEVISFFEGYWEVEKFILESIFLIINTVDSFSDKQYNTLQVNYGCTGGKHRSVYCSQKAYELLRDLFNMNVTIRHIELEKMF